MSNPAHHTSPPLSTFLCETQPARALREALLAVGAQTLDDALRLLEPTPSAVPGLRREMVKREWSQTRAAAELGATQTQISHWLRGKSKPNLTTCQRLAAVLGLSVAELIGESTPSDDTTTANADA